MRECGKELVDEKTTLKHITSNFRNRMCILRRFLCRFTFLLHLRAYFASQKLDMHIYRNRDVTKMHNQIMHKNIFIYTER